MKSFESRLALRLIVLLGGLSLGISPAWSRTEKEDGRSESVEDTHGKRSRQRPIKGNGKRGENERDIDSFRELRVSDGVTTFVKIGKKREVKVVGDANLLRFLRTENLEEKGAKDTRLIVDLYVDEKHRGRPIRPTMPLEVHITMPTLTALVTDDGSVVEVEGLKGDKFSLIVTDGANASVTGTCGNLVLMADDKAVVDAKELVAKRASVRAGDLSKSVINVRKELTVRSDDFARIEYLGSPSKLTLTTAEKSKVTEHSP